MEDICKCKKPYDVGGSFCLNCGLEMNAKRNPLKELKILIQQRYKLDEEIKKIQIELQGGKR